MNELCITIPEMARRLNISRCHGYELAHRVDFYPAFRIGERVVVSVEALNRWVAEQTQTAPVGA